MKPKPSSHLIGIIETVSEKPYRKPNAFHASGLRVCGRAQVLGLMGIEGRQRPGKPEWARSADVGNVIHDYLTNQLNKRGVLERREVPLQPTPEAFVSGRVDAIVDVGGQQALEIKTMAAARWLKFKPGDSKFEDAFSQLQWYLHALNLDRGYILAFNRDTCELKEFSVERDDGYVLSLIARVKRLKAHLDRGTLPEPERDDCYFCEFRDTPHCVSDEDDWLNGQEAIR